MKFNIFAGLNVSTGVGVKKGRLKGKWVLRKRGFRVKGETGLNWKEEKGANRRKRRRGSRGKNEKWVGCKGVLSVQLNIANDQPKYEADIKFRENILQI